MGDTKIQSMYNLEFIPFCLFQTLSSALPAFLTIFCPFHSFDWWTNALTDGRTDGRNVILYVRIIINFIFLVWPVNSL